MTATTEARERVLFTLGDLRFARPGNPDAPEGTTLRGHAAVFNRVSHDLGGFRTRISPGAFRDVLATNPDVHLVWDHNMRYVLARTANNTLDLREDHNGLRVFAKLAPTTYAKDLEILMRRGDLDQMSFACTIGKDRWDEQHGEIVRTILSVDGLFDVTVCAQGAFPQTDAGLLATAIRQGRVPGREPSTIGAGATDCPGVELAHRLAWRSRVSVARHSHRRGMAP